MATTRLLQAVCTAAMLAAVPALAQTNTPNTAAQPAPAENGTADTAPMNQGHAASSGHHMMHHSAMGHSERMMHGRSDTSQNAEVDRLNEQSYQAAQQGQTYSGAGGSGAMMSPGTSGGSGGGSGAMMSPGSSGGSGGGSGMAMPSSGSGGGYAPASPNKP